MKKNVFLLSMAVVLLSTQIAYSGKFFELYKKAMKRRWSQKWKSFNPCGAPGEIRKGASNKGISINDINSEKAKELLRKILFSKAFSETEEGEYGLAQASDLGFGYSKPSRIFGSLWPTRYYSSETRLTSMHCDDRHIVFYYIHQKTKKRILMRYSDENHEKGKRICEEIKELSEEYLGREIGEWKDLPAPWPTEEDTWYQPPEW